MARRLWLVKKAKLPITTYWSAEILATGVEVSVWAKWWILELMRYRMMLPVGITAKQALTAVRDLLRTRLGVL